MKTSSFNNEFISLAALYPSVFGFEDMFYQRHPQGLKQCGGCSEKLGLSMYGLKSAPKGLLRSKCRPCTQAQARNRYLENSDAVKARVYENKIATQTRNREYARSLLLGCRCNMCGSKALPENPLRPISKGLGSTQAVHMAVSSGLSLDAINKAFKDSEIVCDACYREQKGCQINSMWSEKQRVSRRHPKTPHLYLFEKQMHRTYRKVRLSPTVDCTGESIEHKFKQIKYPPGLIPLTPYQIQYMLSLARHLRESPLVLTGNFKVFEALVAQTRNSGSDNRPSEGFPDSNQIGKNFSKKEMRLLKELKKAL